MNKRDQMALEFAKVFLAAQSTPKMTFLNRLKRFFLGEKVSRNIDYGDTDIVRESYYLADEMIKYSEKL